MLDSQDEDDGLGQGLFPYVFWRDVALELEVVEDKISGVEGGALGLCSEEGLEGGW